MNPKWIHMLSAALIAAVTVLSTQFQADIAHHPEVAAILAMAYAVLGHLLPTPPPVQK